MKVTQILVGTKCDPQVRRAAHDLGRYLNKLFGMNPAVRAHSGRGRGLTIQLQVQKGHELSDQGYAFQPDGQTFRIVGGSPTAAVWGVYELAEFWGVRFLLHEDVLPDAPGRLRFPEPATREPLIQQRGFRTYNNWPNTPCQWSLKQIEPLLDQLVKMRFNEILIIQHPYDPFVHIEWRGAKKNKALVNYGYRFPIRKDWIGYELFKHSGDTQRGEFGNSDLAFCDGYEATIRAGKTYLRGLCRMAHERGMKVNAMVVFTDFPEPIKNKLVAISDRRFLRRPDPGPVSTLRYGEWTEGMTKDMARCMTIRNPEYLALLQHSLQTHLEAFAPCDYLILGTSEFRQTGADARFAWKQLDRKYGIGAIATFDQLVKEARRNAEFSPARGESELMSDICTLWVFDHLLNERAPKPGRRAPTLVPGGLSVELHRFLPKIFRSGSRYLASMGYMPSYAIKRGDTLAPARDGHLKFAMILSTEDDNVGIVPQFSGPSVKGIAELIRKNHMHGFITRQFSHSKLLPAVHFLAHASWERGLSLKKSYEHQFAPICGPRALGPLLEAFTILQRLTTQMHQNTDCVSFISSSIIAGWWKVPTRSELTGIRKDLVRFEKLRRTFAKAALLLSEAARLSRPPGRPVVHALARQAEFADHWMAGRIAMRRASEWAATAADAEKQRNVPQYAEATDAVESNLHEAHDLFTRATESWADCVEDRCDLGVLAALNHYALDTMTAIHKLAKLKAISWTINA